MRQQRPVEPVDHARAHDDVRPAIPLVRCERHAPADVPPFGARRDRRRDDRLHVAQAQIEPLRADRREGVGGVADQREPRRGQLRHGLADHREHAAPAFEPHRPEDRARLALDLAHERGVVDRLAAARLPVRHHPDEARPVGRLGARRQRHQRERSLAGVELGGKVAVRQAVRQQRRQRALRVAVRPHGQPGGATRGRGAPVRADDERRGDAPPVAEPHARNLAREVVGRHGRRRSLDARCAGGARGDGVGHAVVLDVPAESLEADFRAQELDRPRRKEGAGVVDHAQRAHRRRLGLDRGPEAERIEIGDRSIEHGDRAPSRESLVGAAGEHVESGPSEGDGGSEAGQSGAGDEHVADAVGGFGGQGHGRNLAGFGRRRAGGASRGETAPADFDKAERVRSSRDGRRGNFVA